MRAIVKKIEVGTAVSDELTDGFVNDMVQFIGKEITVEPLGVYTTWFEGCGWYWHKSWLEFKGD